MRSSTWCPDCYRAKRLLKANNIDFEEIKIDSDEDAARAVMIHNQGRKQVPTFEIEGSLYGSPPWTRRLDSLVSSRSLDLGNRGLGPISSAGQSPLSRPSRI